MSSSPLSCTYWYDSYYRNKYREGGDCLDIEESKRGLRYLDDYRLAGVYFYSITVIRH